MRGACVLAALALALVAGCGNGGGSAGAGGFGGGGASEAQTVVTDFLEAVRNGQGARACTFLDDSRRSKLEGAQPCAEQVGSFAVPEGSTIVAASENGDKAHVKMRAPNGDRYSYELKREGGALKIDGRAGP